MIQYSAIKLRYCVNFIKGRGLYDTRKCYSAPLSVQAQNMLVPNRVSEIQHYYVKLTRVSSLDMSSGMPPLAFC